MNRYPLLLANGDIGYLFLPPYGVTHGDAERVKRMIDSLIVDEDPRPFIAVYGFLSAALATGTKKPALGTALCGFLSSVLSTGTKQLVTAPA